MLILTTFEITIHSCEHWQANQQIYFLDIFSYVIPLKNKVKKSLLFIYFLYLTKHINKLRG